MDKQGKEANCIRCKAHPAAGVQDSKPFSVPRCECCTAKQQTDHGDTIMQKNILKTLKIILLTGFMVFYCIYYFGVHLAG